ncbi:MAG TPA: hypothetical protein VFN67_37825 [Polyangiales bacterium]|nr:hypothetical protein [Polyangiales bacterium]
MPTPTKNQLAGALVLCCACASPTETQLRKFPLEVHVESDPGVPLARARILYDNQERGRTASDGKLRVELAGREGETTGLRVICPEEYRSPEGPVSVALRTLVSNDALPRYHVLCPPQLRSLVVAVRTQRASALPVMYRGREIARTDDSGAAHVLLKTAPKEPVTLVLDTSGDKQLRPKNPELNLEMPFEDKLVLFDQSFTRDAPAIRRASKPAAALGPTPITTPR